jgi:hypothetical protein
MKMDLPSAQTPVIALPASPSSPSATSGHSPIPGIPASTSPLPAMQGSGAITTPALAPPTVISSLPPSPPVPAPPSPPATVAPNVLDANRIGGDHEILPDDTTQSEIGRAGLETIVGAFKVCITAEGSINTVSALKSTGFAAYDGKIQNMIRRSWRYRPFMINGKPAPVCTAVRFVYKQK